VAIAGGLRGCDSCFHVAAAYSLPDPEAIYRVNVEGTRAVLEVAAQTGIPAIVHTSTVGTLGRPGAQGPATEADSFLAPDASDYVRSKFRSEEVAAEVASRGANVVIVHLAAPVGPWDRVPTVTGRRIMEVLRGKWPRYVPGEINHVAVRDVARGMILAAERGVRGRHYLLAREGGNLSRRAFTELVSRVAGIRPPRQRRREVLLGWLRRPSGIRKGGGPASLACDPGRSVRELGLPQTPLEPAFRDAVEWFRGRGMA